MTNVRRLIELGVVPPLAKELVAQIGGGGGGEGQSGAPAALWAADLKRLGTPPGVMTSPPSITVGAHNAVSAITGAANATVSIGPTDSKLTWPGVAPNIYSTGYYSGDRAGKRVRFRFTGRRFEIRFSSVFGDGPSVLVNGDYVSASLFPAGMRYNGNHLLLYDFGANTLTNYAVNAGIAAGGSGYAIGDEVTLAGGTNTTPAVIKVLNVSSGAIVAAAIKTVGSYSAVPSNAVAQASTTGTGTGATFNMVWSKNNTTRAVRDIEIILPRNSGFGGINIDTNDDVTPWPELAFAPKLVIAGDSYVQGNFSDHIGGAFPRRLAYRLGLQDRLVQYGTSGRGYTVAGNLFSSDEAGIIAEAPDIVGIFLGLNDVAGGPAVTAAATTSIQNLMAALPKALFVVTSPWFETGNTNTLAIQAAVTAQTDQSRIRFLDLTATGLYDRSTTAVGTICSDNLHPTQQGHDQIADHLAPLFAQSIASLV